VRAVRTIGRQQGKIRQAIQPAEDIPPGWIVVRSAEAGLLARARESYATIPHFGEPERVAVDVVAMGSAGQPLKLTWADLADRAGQAVTVTSTQLLVPATQHGLDE